MAGNDWVPASRQGQIDMSAMWIMVFQEEKTDNDGKTVKTYENWGIPRQTVLDFGLLYGTALETLTKAKNEQTRTKVVSRECETAFKTLVEMMRDIKRRYFHIPPLADADLASLKLSSPDKTHTPSGSPDAVLLVKFFYKGLRQVGIIIEFITGNPADPANKLYRVYYKLCKPGEAPPTAPEETWLSFSTKRKREALDFQFGDSGSSVYFCARIENGMKKGPWGPMSSIVIP